MSLQTRTQFNNAVYIMDFRRATDLNPENNCTHYNRMKLRAARRIPDAEAAVKHAAYHEARVAARVNVSSTRSAPANVRDAQCRLRRRASAKDAALRS